MTKAAVGFHVGSCPARGRRLVANEPFAIGRFVCSALPTARALSTEQTSRRCHHCWTKLQRRFRCSSCHFACYCSKRCQNDAWSRHRSECRVIKSVCIPRRVLPTPSLLVLFHTVLQRPFDPLPNLVSNWDVTPHDRRADFMQMAVLLNDMLLAVQDFNHTHSVESLALLFARHHSNAFTIADGELQPIGIGIYPYPIHLLNHSCRPNAVVVFEERTSRAVVKATRDIHPDEELTIAYCDVIREKTVRQSELAEQYRFSCSCPSCLESEDVANLQTVTALEAEFLMMLDDERYEAAEKTLSLIDGAEVYKYAPIRNGLHHLKLGKLRFFLGLPGAKICMNRAVNVLCKLLLPDDPVRTEAEQLHHHVSDHFQVLD